MRSSSIPVCRACVFGLGVTLAGTMMMTTIKVTTGDQIQTVVALAEAAAFRSGDQVVADPEDLGDPEVVVPVETRVMDLKRCLPVAWRR